MVNLLELYNRISADFPWNNGKPRIGGYSGGMLPVIYFNKTTEHSFFFGLYKWEEHKCIARMSVYPNDNNLVVISVNYGYIHDVQSLLNPSDSDFVKKLRWTIS